MHQGRRHFQVFTEDSVTVPTLESTFCNWKSMAFEPFQGHIREVLGDEGLRRGRLLKMWPPKANGERGGYRDGTEGENVRNLLQMVQFECLIHFRPSCLTKFSLTHAVLKCTNVRSRRS